MFKAQHIEHQEAIDFWDKTSLGSSSIDFKKYSFEFSRDKEKTTIRIKNQGFFLIPEFDFIQAELKTTDQKNKTIIIQVKPFIQRLYLGLTISFPIFSVFLFRDSNFLAPMFFLIFGLTFYYNFVRIKKDILKFKNILSTYDQL